MEPVSAASAVIAILTPVAKLASGVYEIMRRLRSADSEVYHLWLEVKSFRGILEALHTVLKRDEDSGTQSEMFKQSQVTPICDKVILDMRMLLQGVQRIEDSPLPVPWYALSRYITGRRVKWLFKQSKVAQLYIYLGSLKASLNIVIGILTLEKMERLQIRGEERQKLESEIAEHITQVKILKRKIRQMKRKDHHASLASTDQPSLAEVFAQNDPFRDVLRQAKNYLPERQSASKMRTKVDSGKQRDHMRPPEPPNSELRIVRHPGRQQSPRPPPPISPGGLQPMAPILPDHSPLSRSDSHTRRLPSRAPSEVSEYRGTERSRQGYGPLRPTIQYRTPGSDPTALFRGPDDPTEASSPPRPRYGTILLTSRQGLDDHSNHADSSSDQ